MSFKNKKTGKYFSLNLKIWIDWKILYMDNQTRILNHLNLLINNKNNNKVNNKVLLVILFRYLNLKPID